MPINFNLTFTKPILALVESGGIAGPEGWAKAITSYYSSTVQKGLPIGVPPTLPAPGLNPTTPPPFTIGPSGITKSASTAREKNMYNVLYLYYFAKMQAIDKANIEGLILTVKDLYAKLKFKQEQITRTIEDIKLAKQELENIKPTIELIKKELGDEIEYQKDQIKGLLKTIDDFKTRIEAGNFGSTYGKTGEEIISELFVKEKAIIDLIKDGNILSLNTILKLASLVQTYISDKSSLGGQLSTGNFAGIKNQIKSMLTNMVQNLLNLGKSIMDLVTYFKPEALSNLIKDMLGRRPTLKKVYDLITKFDLFIRYIKPKLKKLAQKKDKLFKEIQTQIQIKIEEAKDFVKQKIKDFNKKIENGRIVKYLKKQKESFELWQKNHKEQIDKWAKNIVLSIELAGRLDTIQKSKERLNDKWNDFANDKEKGLEARIKKYQKIAIELYERTQEQIKRQLKEATAIDDPKLDFSNMNINKLRAELKKLSDYYDKVGIKTPLLIGIGPIIMKQAKLDFEVFQKIFEAEVESLGLMAKEVCVIYLEIKQVRRILRDLKQNNRSKKSKIKTPNSAVYANNPTQLERLIDYVLSVDIAKIKDDLQKYKKKQTDKIKVKIDAFAKETEIILLNLIPLNVEVADKKDRAATAEAKKQKALDIIDESIYYFQLGKEVFKMTDSGLGLLQNLSTKQVLPSQNQTLFNTFLDSFYAYEKLNYKRGHKQPTEANNGLVATYNRSKDREKARVKKEFDVMVLVEMLVKGIKELLKEIQETDFGKELKTIYDESSEELKQKVKGLITFFTNPTEDVGAILEAVINLDLTFITHPDFMNKLRALEKKHLVKTRQVLKIMLGIVESDTTTGNLANRSPKVNNAISAINYALVKNDYFIDILFTLIKNLYIRFIAFMKELIKKILKKATERLKQKVQKAKDKKIEEQKTEASKKINLDAPILQAVLTIAIRAYWTGASWYGPTNSRHIVTQVGSFRPKIKAPPIDGLFGLVKEMELGFTNQMTGIKGIIIPPAETGISPLSFSQYN